MEPYKAKSMPIDYSIDKEMLKLISEANAKYGEYKSLLNTLEFDAGFFLNSIILNESYKSSLLRLHLIYWTKKQSVARLIRSCLNLQRNCT